jgi:hypothetical protein
MREGVMSVQSSDRCKPNLYESMVPDGETITSSASRDSNARAMRAPCSCSIPAARPAASSCTPRMMWRGWRLGQGSGTSSPYWLLEESLDRRHRLSEPVDPTAPLQPGCVRHEARAGAGGHEEVRLSEVPPVLTPSLPMRYLLCDSCTLVRRFVCFTQRSIEPRQLAEGWGVSVRLLRTRTRRSGGSVRP